MDVSSTLCSSTKEKEALSIDILNEFEEEADEDMVPTDVSRTVVGVRCVVMDP